MKKMLITAILCMGTAGCAREGSATHGALSEPPTDRSLSVTADTVAGWLRRNSMQVDLDGDGRAELLVAGADVSISARGKALWEDGHRWGVFVEQPAGRTLLYSAFLPHAVVEVGVTGADSQGRRHVLIVERGPQHARTLVVAFDSAGSARLVSYANYPLERWLPSLTAEAPQPHASLPPPAPAAAPWSRDTLRAADVPREFLVAWQAAANRENCAPIAPANTRVANARPRIAQFSGGWGVAFDTPDQRSAFGVAGAGIEPDDAAMTRWPRGWKWPDGSRAGWGPEGGTGPNQLAYLEINGQGCLYNVWSRLGEEHLTFLLLNLRFVRVE